MKNIGILGASGSIGTQTIDVIKNNPDKFILSTFSVGNNIKYANEIIKQFPSVKLVSVLNEDDIDKIENKNIKVVSGMTGLNEVATYQDVETLVTAVVGSVGLEPTIKAIKEKKDIALANKETLVVAGHIIMPLIKEYNVKLLPVDSEHSAIFQALNGENLKEVNKIILTASGGSFRDKTRKELQGVTKDQALNHPNWSMGAKITIDSATMFNKGLEIIEAHHLFNLSYDDIDCVIHPQSIIHSIVEYDDYSQIAQLGTPDMRLPIQYALTYPNRLEIKNSQPLDLKEIATLTFREVDFNRYPAVKLAYDAGRLGGSAPTILNAANEVAVDLFLNGKIEFLEIDEIVSESLVSHQVIQNPSLEDILKLDQETRKQVYNKWSK